MGSQKETKKKNSRRALRTLEMATILWKGPEVFLGAFSPHFEGLQMNALEHLMCSGRILTSTLAMNPFERRPKT